MLKEGISTLNIRSILREPFVLKLCSKVEKFVCLFVFEMIVGMRKESKDSSPFKATI